MSTAKDTRSARTDAKAVACPACLALEGVNCQAASGRKVHRSHTERAELFDRTQSEDPAMQDEAEAEAERVSLAVRKARGITWKTSRN
jgi:hypothetical protein